MEEVRNMKIFYVLMVLILAASALGCVGNKPAEVTPSTPSTQAPPTQVVTPASSTVSPAETPVSAPATTTPVNDQFGTQSDLSTIDLLINDSSMNIPLYDVNI